MLSDERVSACELRMPYPRVTIGQHASSGTRSAQIIAQVLGCVGTIVRLCFSKCRTMSCRILPRLNTADGDYMLD